MKSETSCREPIFTTENFHKVYIYDGWINHPQFKSVESVQKLTPKFTAKANQRPLIEQP